jgi:hypothetical protein
MATIEFHYVAHDGTATVFKELWVNRVPVVGEYVASPAGDAVRVEVVLHKTKPDEAAGGIDAVVCGVGLKPKQLDVIIAGTGLPMKILKK